MDPLTRKVARRFAAQEDAGSHVAVTPPGWEGPVKEMKKDKDVDNPWALAWWQKGQGHTPHKEAYTYKR